MTDTAACERLLTRLVAARWDDDEAEMLHETSRGALASEFFRRKAVWANALGVTRQWPFADIALLFDPSLETDPMWLERLQAAVGRELLPTVRKVVTDMFRWASLGDRPYVQFPEFDDPYEPMVQVFERGGEFLPGQGGIDLPIAGVAYRSLDFRLEQAPIPIDAATLAALDEKDRIQLEEAEARMAARHAEQSPQEPGTASD
ncbi:hypothetical protein EV651_10272 [Kribbella sp. VKM Ac-2571]|uniref:hypothetical protein n=1 Tax=Kribbella sp. VKM Ac-2571 TaxID=2512222 RepID=UPI00106046FE|nr:hypothetical protein [Kribbella sp. VKM Ac-2571]TDO68153.1 hypothetical protein EV651_10272 [Kribbella sp. VKM Ac-2571]